MDDTRWGIVRNRKSMLKSKEYTLFAGVYGGFGDGSIGK